MKSAKQNNESGFTLMEVVAVLALAGVVTAVIANSFLQSVYTQKQLTGRYTASVLAEGKLAEIVNEAEMDTYGKFPAPYKDYGWSSELETQDNGVKMVTLTVKWSTKDGRAHQKVFKKPMFNQ